MASCYRESLKILKSLTSFTELHCLYEMLELQNDSIDSVTKTDFLIAILNVAPFLS